MAAHFGFGGKHDTAACVNIPSQLHQQLSASSKEGYEPFAVGIDDDCMPDMHSNGDADTDVYHDDMMDMETVSMMIDADNSSNCTSEEVHGPPAGDDHPGNVVCSHAILGLDFGVANSQGQQLHQQVLTPGQATADDYAVDVFLWKYRQQHKYAIADPLSEQPDVTWQMREKVLRWLWRVNCHLEYSLENWCLSVALIDRFLSLQPLHPDCLQLISLTAFFIAAKLEEREPPVVFELVSLCASAYSSKQFDWMEKVMLNLLEFNLRPPTTSFFLQHVVELERFSHCWPWPFSHALVQNCVCRSELVTQVLPAHLAHAIFSVVVDRFNVDYRIHNFASGSLNGSTSNGGSDGSNRTFNFEQTVVDDMLIDEYCKRVILEVIQQMQPQQGSTVATTFQDPPLTTEIQDVYRSNDMADQY